MVILFNPDIYFSYNLSIFATASLMSSFTARPTAHVLYVCFPRKRLSKRANKLVTLCRKAEPPTPSIENLELLIGDAIGLVSFCTYKQIAAIVINPGFEGWSAPLRFNPTRFEEFAGFVVSVCGTWIAASTLLGGYKRDATSSLPTALNLTMRVWLATMSIAAAQLVLATAAEDVALVATEGFATKLPLAASGPGEPFVTAAGVLGLMAIWRSFYATYFDFSVFLSIDGARSDRDRKNARHFQDALVAALVLAASSLVILHVLSSALTGAPGLFDG